MSLEGFSPPSDNSHDALKVSSVAALTWFLTGTSKLNKCYSGWKWIGYSPGLSLCTHSSTVVCSSASVLASFSLRRLHSSALRSSSCCRSFKSVTVFLSASLFWWRSTQNPYLSLILDILIFCTYIMTHGPSHRNKSIQKNVQFLN